jgi:hypothetical protein
MRSFAAGCLTLAVSLVTPRAVAVAVGAALGVTLVAPDARADDMESLFGEKPKPFIDPAGFYAVVFPSGFNCEARPRRVECIGSRGGNARLVVDVVDSPPSADVNIVFINEAERFQKQPHFKLISKKTIKVDGTPAIAASYSYDYMGNVERSVGVKAVYVVRQTKTYVIHFEAPLGVFKEYMRDLDMVYATFKPARLDASGNPILEDLKPKVERTGNEMPDVEKALKSGF